MYVSALVLRPFSVDYYLSSNLKTHLPPTKNKKKNDVFNATFNDIKIVHVLRCLRSLTRCPLTCVFDVNPLVSIEISERNVK